MTHIGAGPTSSSWRRGVFALALAALMGCAAPTTAADRSTVDEPSCGAKQSRSEWLKRYFTQEEAPADAAPDVSHVEYNDYVHTSPTHGNTLYDVLEARGLTPDRVGRIHMSLGDSPGAADITDPEEIENFWWTYFRPAEPYKHWLPTRPHQIAIFLKGRDDVAAAALRVNETDSTGIDDHPLTFMCRGLSDRVQEEIDRATQSAK